jgi:hypothetical protein
MFWPIIILVAKIVFLIVMGYTAEQVARLQDRVKKLEDTLQGLLNEIPKP